MRRINMYHSDTALFLATPLKNMEVMLITEANCAKGSVNVNAEKLK